MAAEIETSWKYEYSDNTRLTCQQKQPKIAYTGAIRVETASGEGFRPEMTVGEAAVQERTVRLEKRTPQELGVNGRWLSPRDYDCGPYPEDTLDRVRNGIQLNGTFVQSSVAAINRHKDRVAVTAMFGSAATGKNGTGAAAVFDTTDMRVAAGGTNMTVAKLADAKAKLIYQEVDLDEEQAHVAMTEKQWKSLMNDMKAISGDYNDEKPLKKGVIEEYVGFKIIVVSSRRLNFLSSTDRRCPFWVPSGVYLGMWDNLTSDIYEDKSYRGTTYMVYSSYSMAATRLDEKKVGDILCTES
jgi:hypothetical protein